MRIALFFTACIFLIASGFTAVDKPSEMAKLMKRWLVFIREEKIRIEHDEKPLRFPTDKKRMDKARITPGKKQSEHHEQYVSDFFTQLKKYYESKNTQERKTSFNLLVQSCVACHEEECPGPIQVIERNTIR